ncbi:hypothetical protein ABH935_007193 [Catenulispora sp. GAS73]
MLVTVGELGPNYWRRNVADTIGGFDGFLWKPPGQTNDEVDVGRVRPKLRPKRAVPIRTALCRQRFRW